METPILSVITVCFRAKDALRATAENLLAQSWTNFEYVVIDGGSDDGTETYLQELAPLLAAKDIPFFASSEKDKGIYDAMNKGVQRAHGTWLLFLNAGDLLVSPDTLSQCFQTAPSAPILYGDTICIYEGQQKYYPALPLDHLIYEMAFCHQSVFIARELLLHHPYDLSYQVCADHEFFLSMYQKQVPFDYLPIPISIYEIAGFSDRNKLLSHKEQHRMQKELGLFRITPSWLTREGIFYTKFLLKTIFGQKLINLVRKKRLH